MEIPLKKEAISPSPLYIIKIMNFLGTGLIITPETFIQCKNVWRPRKPGAMTFDIPDCDKFGL